MQRFLRGKKTLAGLAIAGGAAIAAVGSAAPALGFFSPPLLLQIHVNTPATLVAKGAGANVTVQIQCAGAQTASVASASPSAREARSRLVPDQRSWGARTITRPSWCR